jgi:hypothetical protein
MNIPHGVFQHGYIMYCTASCIFLGQYRVSRLNLAIPLALKGQSASHDLLNGDLAAHVREPAINNQTQ